MKLTATDYKKLRKRKRIGYDNRYKLHLKFLSENCKCGLICPMDKERHYAWVSKIYGENNSRNVVYYERQYFTSHKSNRYKFYKKYSNHVVRRCKKEIKNGGSYKKCFDYWWTVD